MSSTQLSFLVAFVVLFFVLRALFGARNALLGIYLVSLGGFGMTFFGGQAPPDVAHYGIAAGSPAVTLSLTLGIATAIAFQTPAAKRSYSYALIFAVLLLLGILLVWGNDSRQWSGALLLTFALVNVGIGPESCHFSAPLAGVVVTGFRRPRRRAASSR